METLNSNSSEPLDSMCYKEDEEIIKCIKTIFDVVHTKCNRCPTKWCLGCVFSHGELLFHMGKAAKLMYLQNEAKVSEVFFNKKSSSLTDLDEFIESL